MPRDLSIGREICRDPAIKALGGEMDLGWINPGDNNDIFELLFFAFLCVGDL
jgi:hypothetical protein